MGTKIKLYLLTALLTVGGRTVAHAQQDTLFWFAAPEVSASVGDNPIYLRFMTYSNAANVNVSMPANGGFTPINLAIPANSVDSINLTPFLSAVESPGANSVEQNGLKITSSEEISAFYELNSSTNKEVFSLKGNKALGDNFYTPFQNFWDNGATTPSTFSSFEIVATENNTTVLITPRTAITGHAQDVTFSVLLNEGETYSARDMNTTAASTLAGSIISSDKPVAVTLFNGALSESGCTSTVGDQITSETYAGKEFIVHNSTSSNDRVYILATQNGTNLTIDNSGTTSTLINWGETYELPLSDAINHISASKPVYVWHVSGYGCNLSGAQVPHMVCAGKYNSAFTRSSTDSLGLILFTRTGFEDDFTLNGNGTLIPAAAFSPVPGTSGEYQAALIYFNTTDVPVNSYNEVTNSGDIFGLGIISGNGGDGSSYAYFSEFISYPTIDSGPDDTVCANISLPINGVIGGGDVTGQWSTSGFGSFANPVDNLSNTYIPDPLDSLISPIQLILTTTGPCPLQRDTILLTVDTAPIVSASADQAACENNSVVALAGSVQGGSSTGVWTTLGTGTFSPDSVTLDADYIPSASDIASGSIQLVLTSTNMGSCIAESDTMEISFTVAATVDAGVDTSYYCENNSLVSLSGTVTGVTTTGKWLSSGNGVFTPDNLDLNATYQPSIADISAGSVWLYLESTSNGSCVPVVDSQLVIFTAPPSVDAGVNLLSCTNDSTVVLSGTISGATTSGIWTGGAGTFTSSNTDLGATYAPTSAEVQAGTVFLTLTSTSNGSCLSENDVVQISFIAPPYANFNYTEECLYDASVFTDFSLPGYGNIDSWNWDFGDSGTSSNQNETHQYSAPGTYNVELVITSDAGCADSVVIPVEVFEVPVADFTYTADCPNNQIIVDFTDQSSTVSDAITFHYYDFGGQGTAATANPSQLFTADGDYTILHIVGTSNGCYDTISDILNVPAFPNAGFSYNSNNGMNIGAVFNFVNTATDAITYSWDFGNGQSSVEENPSNTYFANGTYLVTQHVTGELGCTDSITDLITINTVTQEINTLIPNAISPNGDNKNDVWKLEFLDLLYPNAHVEIMNEWGQSIFVSDGYNEPWDGTFNGELVPDGTYYYIIDLNDSGNPDKDIFKGTILVLKSKN